MKKEKKSFILKLINFDKHSKAFKEVERAEGIISATIVDDALVCELYYWADLDEIREAVIAILAGYSISVESAEAVEEGVDEIDQPAYEEDALQDGVINDEQPQSQEQSMSLAFKKKIFEDKNEKLTTKERAKKVKNDFLFRLCEIAISLICLIVAILLPKSENVFSAQMIFFIVSFAVSAYEIFYFAILAIVKKRFFDGNIIISIALLALAILGKTTLASLLAIVQAIVVAVIQFNSKRREVLISQLICDESEEIENERIKEESRQLDEFVKPCGLHSVIFGIIGYISALSILLIFIPALNTSEIYLFITLIAVCFATLSSQAYNEIYKSAIVKARLSGISFSSLSSILTLAKANSVAIDSSLLISSGVVDQTSLGALKELALLGIKNLKTNFDSEISDHLKEQIDFLDRDFKGKREVEIGKGKFIQFNQDGAPVNLKNQDKKSIATCYRLATSAYKKSKVLSAVTGAILFVLAVIVAVLVLVLHITFFTEILTFVGLFAYLVIYSVCFIRN